MFCVSFCLYSPLCIRAAAKPQKQAAAQNNNMTAPAAGGSAAPTDRPPKAAATHKPPRKQTRRRSPGQRADAARTGGAIAKGLPPTAWQPAARRRLPIHYTGRASATRWRSHPHPNQPLENVTWNTELYYQTLLYLTNQTRTIHPNDGVTFMFTEQLSTHRWLLVGFGNVARVTISTVKGLP